MFFLPAVCCVWGAYILVHQSLLLPEMDSHNKVQILAWLVKSMIFASVPASLLLAGALPHNEKKQLPTMMAAGMIAGVTCYFGALLSISIYFYYFGDLPYPTMLFERWRETWSIRDQIVAQLMHGKEWVLLLLWLASVMSIVLASVFRRFPSRKGTARLVCIVLAANICFHIYKGIQGDITEDVKFGYINLAQTHGIGAAYGFMAFDTLFAKDAGATEPPYPGKINPAGTPSSPVRLPRRTNVIILQVESLDGGLLDMEVAGRPVTPFLNQLKKRGIFFPKCIAQHSGGGTSDCELSVLTSLLPNRKGSGFQTARYPLITALPAVLGENGYTTAVLHPNYASYFHRAEAFPRLGFDHYFHDRHFKGAAKGMHAHDKPFLEQSADIIKTLPNPFYAHLITIQSHGPFGNITDTAFRDVIKAARPQAVDILVDYLAVIHEVDDALAHFFNLLESRGLLDNSLILVFSDHVSSVLDRKTTYEQIPLILIHPGLLPAVLTTPCSHLDIAPTITSLLGLPEPGRWLGTALLPADPHRSVVINGPIRIQADGDRLSAVHSPQDLPFIHYSDYLLGR